MSGLQQGFVCTGSSTVTAREEPSLNMEGTGLEGDDDVEEDWEYNNLMDKITDG